MESGLTLYSAGHVGSVAVHPWVATSIPLLAPASKGSKFQIRVHLHCVCPALSPLQGRSLVGQSALSQDCQDVLPCQEGGLPRSEGRRVSAKGWESAEGTVQREAPSE